MSDGRTYQERLADCRESRSIVRSGICETLSVLIRLLYVGVVVAVFQTLLTLLVGLTIGWYPTPVEFASAWGSFTALVTQMAEDFTLPEADR